MADYDGMNPDKSRTDPQGLHQNPFYPAHLKKWAGEGLPNDCLVVNNDEQKAAALRDGWSETPILVAPKDADEESADTAPKPKRGRVQ